VSSIVLGQRLQSSADPSELSVFKELTCETYVSPCRGQMTLSIIKALPLWGAHILSPTRSHSCPAKPCLLSGMEVPLEQHLLPGTLSGTFYINLTTVLLRSHPLQEELNKSPNE